MTSLRTLNCETKNPTASALGADGTDFGCEWTSNALAEAEIGEDARATILHRYAEAIMSRLAKSAQRESAAA